MLSLPGVTAITSSEDIHILNRILESVSRLRPLSRTKEEAVVAAADPAQTIFA